MWKKIASLNASASSPALQTQIKKNLSATLFPSRTAPASTSYSVSPSRMVFRRSPLRFQKLGSTKRSCGWDYPRAENPIWSWRQRLKLLSSEIVLPNKCRWHYIFKHGNGIENCSMKTQSKAQILQEDHARDALLHGGTVDSFVNLYHPNLRFPAFRAYIKAVRNALFRPRTGRRPPST